jgi:FkbM family methyltransferase
MTTAKWIHKLFPFCQLRTAKFLLRLNKGSALKVECTLFNYKIELDAHRSTVHILIFMLGEKFLEDDVTFLGPHIKEGMTVFDVGANIGYITYFLCNQIGPKGRVFSFEPDPDNFAELSNNVIRNNVVFCRPVQTAVGSFDGTVAFNFGLNGSVNTGPGPEPNCKITSLDSFVREHSIPQVDLIKIDVEGYELDVLEGMSEILSNGKRPLLYIEAHPMGFGGKGDPARVCSVLEKYYTNIYAYLPLGDLRSTFSKRNKLLTSIVPKKYPLEKCKVTLSEVKKNTKLRYQLLCLP